MTKETLMQMGLTEEQANKVMEGLNGSFVPKTRFNEVNTELQTAKATIKERDGQLETLRKATGDTKALQDQITQLQADNKKKDEDHAAELKALKINAAVDRPFRMPTQSTPPPSSPCWPLSWRRPILPMMALFMALLMKSASCPRRKEPVSFSSL